MITRDISYNKIEANCIHLDTGIRLLSSHIQQTKTQRNMVVRLKAYETIDFEGKAELSVECFICFMHSQLQRRSTKL